MQLLQFDEIHKILLPQSTQYNATEPNFPNVLGHLVGSLSTIEGVAVVVVDDGEGAVPPK